MFQWLTDFVAGFTELSVPLMVLFGLLIIGGVLMVILNVKKAPKVAVYGVVVLMVILLGVVLAVNFPEILPDLESGGITAGQWLYSGVFWIAVLCVIGIVALILLLRHQQWTTSMLATASLCIAMGFILSCFTLYKLPQGGSITPASMLPLIFFAWAYGPVPGITAGMVYGMLQLVQGAYVIHPVQFLLDYLFPFASLGLAGLLGGKKQLPWAIVVACAFRFVMHFLSGYVFFGDYAPEGQAPAVYSLLYNGSYMLPDTIICVVVAMLPPVKRMFDHLYDRAHASR